MNIYDIRLVQTCGACPEQYDAFIGDKQVGYLRLRHGYFRVDYLKCGGQTVYEAHPHGDGIFADHEREHFLSVAKLALLDAYLKDNKNKQLDWLDATLVQPPPQTKKNYSELVMMKFNDKNEVAGCAVYDGIKFIGWSTTSTVVEWAYYK
jgi:hypothetical protein